MRPVQIVGAGFSGLTTAWALTRRGIPVSVHEAAAAPGGLISTPSHEYGSYETAANALVNSVDVEDLFADLGLALSVPTPAAKKRYILRGEPKRLPLGVREVASTVVQGVMSYVTGQAKPRPYETLNQWGYRVLGGPATRHLVGPAFQGIYAGDPARLSATLILGHFFERRKQARPRVRGTVFPEHGMQQLMERLVEKICERGGTVSFNEKIPALTEQAPQPIVIATSAPAAAALLRAVAPEASEKLAGIETLSMVLVQLYVERLGRTLEGFGCLFPAGAGFESLGVLFEHNLYPGRLKAGSERWIMGGSRSPTLGSLSDQSLIDLAFLDHVRFGGRAAYLGATVTRRPNALPHYTVDLERILARLSLPSGVYLCGNYLGRIGLSDMLSRAIKLAGDIAGTYDL